MLPLGHSNLERSAATIATSADTVSPPKMSRQGTMTLEQYVSRHLKTTRGVDANRGFDYNAAKDDYDCLSAADKRALRRNVNIQTRSLEERASNSPRGSVGRVRAASLVAMHSTEETPSAEEPSFDFRQSDSSVRTYYSASQSLDAPNSSRRHRGRRLRSNSAASVPTRSPSPQHRVAPTASAPVTAADFDAMSLKELQAELQRRELILKIIESDQKTRLAQTQSCEADDAPTVDPPTTGGSTNHFDRNFSNQQANQHNDGTDPAPAPAAHNTQGQENITSCFKSVLGEYNGLYYSSHFINLGFTVGGAIVIIMAMEDVLNDLLLTYGSGVALGFVGWLLDRKTEREAKAAATNGQPVLRTEYDRYNGFKFTSAGISSGWATGSILKSLLSASYSSTKWHPWVALVCAAVFGLAAFIRDRDLDEDRRLRAQQQQQTPAAIPVGVV